MRTSAQMGLQIWDLGGDLYSHSQLAGNFDTIDAHDHSPGKGAPISGASLQNGSITNSKLGSNSVTSDKIQDGTITGADIANGTITLDKLNPAVYSLFPLGSVIPWYRPNTSFAVPSNCVLCIGQTLTQNNHDWAGAGTIQVPDLRNRFILGAATSGTGTTVDLPPAESNGSSTSYGGQHTRDLSHTHPIDDDYQRIYDVPPDDGPDDQMYSRGMLFSVSGKATDIPGLPGQTLIPQLNLEFAQSLYVPGLDDDDQVIPHTHNHGGATETALSTAQALRPAFVGLLYIMKVKLS